MADTEYHRMLAEIVTSQNVGGLHVRRVGELLVARELLNEWCLRNKSNGEWRVAMVDIVDRLVELDEKCSVAWELCKRGDHEWLISTGLPSLADVLQESADFCRSVIADQRPDE